MTRRTTTNAHTDLLCSACGQFPEPPKSRLVVANLAAVLPIELLVHAAVLSAELPYFWKVLTLAVTTTVLVMWVAEPSVARLLRRWLHAAALKHRRRYDAAPALWRARTVVDDRPGSLERITHALSCLDVNILSIQVHPVVGGALDEFVLSTPAGITEQDLLDALEAGSGRRPRVWTTTALALADGQTRALGLAAKVAADPDALPHAAASLLSAVVLDDDATRSLPVLPKDGTVLKIPTVWGAPLLLSRPDEPFTPAESARAHRLAELAETVQLTGRSQRE
jgi:hypothetical protein